MTEIKFEDIREGDKIRTEHPEGGIKFMCEGVAHKNTRDGWFTSEGGFLVSARSTATITLLHRPAPAEPEGLGAMVRAVVGGNEWYFHRIGTGERPWINVARNWHAWSEFDPDSIEVLYEGDQ